MSRSRNWCFTLNNYSESDVENVLKWDVRYIKFGKETGESGTPHLQGYVVLDAVARLSKLKKLCPRSHWEPMKGTIEQNDRYVSKEGDIYEAGDSPKTSAEKGTDEKIRWGHIRKLAEEGNFEELNQLYPKESVLYDRNIERIHKKAQKVATIDGEM